MAASIRTRWPDRRHIASAIGIVPWLFRALAYPLHTGRKSLRETIDLSRAKCRQNCRNHRTDSRFSRYFLCSDRFGLFISDLAAIELRQLQLDEIGRDTVGAPCVTSSNNPAADILAKLQLERCLQSSPRDFMSRLRLRPREVSVLSFSVAQPRGTPRAPPKSAATGSIPAIRESK